MAFLTKTGTESSSHHLHLFTASWVCLPGVYLHGIRVGSGGVRGWCVGGAIDCFVQGFGKVVNGRKVGKFSL